MLYFAQRIVDLLGTMSKPDVQSDLEQDMQASPAPPGSSRAQVALPPLRAGERLTRDEFEQRYELTPSNVKAELIEGIVLMPSPVRAARHARPHALIMAWLGAYWVATPGVTLFDNATLRLDLDNEPQPDAVLSIEAARGGRAWISADDYLEGAPELVVEVAASSAAYDVGDKLAVYQRNGVAEYIVWRIDERRLDWWRLGEGGYVPLHPAADGLIRSHVFPGLHLHVKALLAEDRPAVLATLQDGLATAEHAAFVQRLVQQP